MLTVTQVERNVFYMEAIYPTSAEVGETVKRAIKAAGFTQDEVAAKSGIAPTTFSRRLNGGPFTHPELTAVGRVIGRRVSELLAAAEDLASERLIAA